MHAMQSEAGTPLSSPPSDDRSTEAPTDRSTERPTEPTTDSPIGAIADGIEDKSVAVAPAFDTRRRSRLLALVAVIAVLAFASDQGSKALALDRLADGQPRNVIGEFIQFRLIGNPGAALSLGDGNTWIMTIIAIGVFIALLVATRRLGSRAWAIAFGLLLGSALGNLLDRFVRPPGGGQGHVVDFIDYNRWFIGNVADIWIVVGAALIMILAFTGIGIDGRREGAASDA